MNNMQILIVEDEKKIAQILVDYLERDGFLTTVIHDGAEALARTVKSIYKFRDLARALGETGLAALQKESRTVEIMDLLMEVVLR